MAQADCWMCPAWTLQALERLCSRQICPKFPIQRAKRGTHALEVCYWYRRSGMNAE
jgi:hypothetical protein